MDIPIVTFLKKTYKVIAVLLAVTFFFIFYNVYLVDRSLVNLNFALNELAQAQTISDFKNIQPLLKFAIMKEMASKEVDSVFLLSLETADSTLSNAKTVNQKDVIAFYLKNALQKRELKRNTLLVSIDKLNGALFGANLSSQEKSNISRVDSIVSKISVTNDPNTKQLLYYELGILYLQSDNYIKAQEAFFTSIDIIPGNQASLKAKFNLARSYVYTKEYERAVILFNEISESDADIKLKLTSQYEYADVLYRAGRYQEARDKYAQLAKSNPQLELSALALQRAGLISMYYLNDFKEALRFFYELGMIRAGSVSLFDLKDIVEALKYFSELENNLPNSNPAAIYVKKTIRRFISNDFLVDGYRLLKEKKYSEAILSFKKALSIDSSDSLSLVGEGLCLYWMDLKDEASDKAVQAASLDMSNELTATNAIFICLNTGKVNQAVEIGKKFIGAKMGVIASAEFYYNLGYAYVLSEQIDEAMTYLNRAIRQNEDFVFSYNNLGCAFWSKKNYARAIQMYEKAISLYPAYADAYFNLGIVYFQLGRLEDSHKEFQRAMDTNPDYKSAKEYLTKIEKTLKYNPSENNTVGQLTP